MTRVLSTIKTGLIVGVSGGERAYARIKSLVVNQLHPSIFVLQLGLVANWIL